jgi:signal transduction histidine kinase
MTEHIHQDEEGNLTSIEIRGYPIFDPHGNLTHMIEYALDTTERRQAEEAQRQYARELRARNEELDAFAHTVAHDLQSPLAVLLGFTEALQQHHVEMSAEELDNAFQAMARSGHKMDSIVDELLLLAGVRKMDVELQPLNLDEILDDVLHRLRSLIEQHQARIVLPEAWPEAWGYSPWVEEVWVNYISNAIKYGGHPPSVEVGAVVEEDGAVRFWVRDNGQGLAPKDQAHLFKPFTQLNQVNTKGYGLGLSIVRRIVERLGGEVGVTSVLGQGSTFTFTLPSRGGTTSA